MKFVTWAGGLLGLILLLVLGLHANLGAMLHALRAAGWPLLVLIPWRLVFLALYALGWFVLLLDRDLRRRAGFLYLVWVTAVREAADRLLLPTVGGGLIGLRLLGWRGLAPASVGASILAEMAMTFAASYVFAGLGLWLLFAMGSPGWGGLRVAGLFALSLVVPIAFFIVLRFGSLFSRLKKLMGGWLSGLTSGAERLDEQLAATLRATPQLAFSGALQILAMVSGSLEVWLAMRLFGHQVPWVSALIMEGLLQAVRVIGFFVPASIGTQEGGLIMFGRALGIPPELSLAVSMVKRVREVAVGVPFLLSWHFLEVRRARTQTP